MENFKKALENAKMRIDLYNESIAKNDRKIELYTIAQEFEEAKYADRSRQSDLRQLEYFKTYVKAIEFYMEHNLQEA